MEVLEQIISQPQSAILNSVKSVNLFLAGVGSGKTYLGGIISYRFVSQFPECTGFIATNTYDQLNLSTLFRIREYWKSIGITEWTKENQNGTYVAGKQPPSHFKKDGHNFDSYNSIICFINGAIIFTGSLENAKSHEGKQFSWSILDETKDSRESDVKEIIIARLRQKGLYVKNGKLSHEGDDFNPLYILTSPAKTDWLAEWFELEKYANEISEKIYSDKTFFQKEFGNKFITISSTYHNQRNLPTNYIDNIKQNNTEERFKALVYSNPFSLTGGEFYSSFDRLTHVGKVQYDPQLPIHISFDQNSVPYNSAGLSQIRRINERWNQWEWYWEWRIFDEIALVNPRNSTEDVCEEFIFRYPNHKSGLFYYGDASGHARHVSTGKTDYRHHYEVVEYKLNKYLVNDSDRTLLSNPSIPLRRDFFNKIFEGKLPIKIVIDESCHYTINDFMYVKQALDGTKDKHIVEDRETGDKYQKYGHFSDCFVGETMIMTDNGEKTMRDIEPCDYVLTRNGYRKVIAKQHKGIKIVNRYKIGDKEITCTDEHRIFANGDFIIVSALINKNINTIFARKATWKESLLSWMGINFINTRKQRNHLIEIITKAGLRHMDIGEKFHCIGIFGKRLMERFQKDLQSITSMATSKIIESKIIILSAFLIIWNCIIDYPVRNRKTRELSDYWSWLFQKQLNGINQKQERNGTEITLINLYTRKNIQATVSTAGKNLHLIFGKGQNIVQENVNSNIKHEDTELKGNITKKESVSHAETFSKHINGIQLSSVHVPVCRMGESKRRFVYDLTVEQDHEFFANGVLVHNCWDYCAVELFKTYYNG